MRTVRIATLLFLAVAVGLAAASAGTLDDDLALMVSWFGGEFDNHLQVLEEKENPPEQTHEWIHSIFTPVDLPAFGEHVFYVEQYGDNDPTKIYRNRIYSFTTNQDAGAIQLTIYAFPDPKAVYGAHRDPSKIAGLKPADLTTYPGCEVYWKREGDRFIGYMKEGACQITSRRTGKTIIVGDNLVLTKDEIWIGDRATDEDGNLVWGNKAGIQHKLKRARRFSCWATVRVKEGDEWAVKRGMSLHDQGATARLVAKGKDPQKFEVQLEQRVYKGQGGIPVLKLALTRDGEDKAFAYTWANPGATRIGLNLRWIQAGCSAE